MFQMGQIFLGRSQLNNILSGLRPEVLIRCLEGVKLDLELDPPNEIIYLFLKQNFSKLGFLGSKPWTMVFEPVLDR
jgi:hypothetical protein